MKRVLPMLAVALVMTGAPAAAEPRQVEIAVSHADLDLSDPKSVSELKRRVSKAAESACTTKAGLTTMPAVTDHACKSDLVKAAYVEIEQRRTRVLASAE